MFTLTRQFADTQDYAPPSIFSTPILVAPRIDSYSESLVPAEPNGNLAQCPGIVPAKVFQIILCQTCGKEQPAWEYLSWEDVPNDRCRGCERHALLLSAEFTPEVLAKFTPEFTPLAKDGPRIDSFFLPGVAEAIALMGAQEPAAEVAQSPSLCKF